jgi:hypothetical protein
MRKPIWFLLAFFLSGTAFGQWKLQQIDLKVEFRGLSAVNEKVAWASGGRTWTLIRDSGLAGFRSCIAYLPGAKGKQLLAVGPAGSDYSTDGGMHWAKYDSQGFHVFAFAKARAIGWAAGAGGRIAKYQPILTASGSR